jgi:exopolyphosphatase/guanosine-5'-triphosphate,3'-diphosphate pyrophosphatase
MLCAAIDIGSNTTRILVAEPVEGQLKKVMEQRAYTRIGQSRLEDGTIPDEKIAEVAEVVETQVKLAREVGAEGFRAVATAALRDAPNGQEAARAIEEVAGIQLSIVTEREEGRLAFLGATKALGHPTEGRIAIVDVGGGSTEITIGTVEGGVEGVRSWPIGSGQLAQEVISSDPPSASEIRRIRDRVDEVFADVRVDRPDQAVAVGGSATSLRKIVGARLEYETLERAIRVLCGDEAVEVGRQFELDPVRVRILPTGVLILEKLSELLGQELQIGKGGIREGIVLDMLNGGIDVSDLALTPG